jgi:hypothetical protein
VTAEVVSLVRSRWRVRVSVEIAARVCVLAAGACAVFALAAVDHALWVVASSSAVAFAIGAVLRARGSVPIPQADAIISSVSGARRMLVWSVVSAALVPTVVVAICAFAASGFRGIPAGLLAAWSFEDWRVWRAVRRFESSEGVTFVADRPFIPYARREIYAFRSV